MSTKMVRIPEKLYEKAMARAAERSVSIGEALSQMDEEAQDPREVDTASGADTPMSTARPGEVKQGQVLEKPLVTPDPQPANLAEVLERLEHLETAHSDTQSTLDEVLESLEEFQEVVTSVEVGLANHLSQHQEGYIDTAMTREAILETLRSANLRGNVIAELERRFTRVEGEA